MINYISIYSSIVIIEKSASKLKLKFMDSLQAKVSSVKKQFIQQMNSTGAFAESPMEKTEMRCCSRCKFSHREL